MSSRPPAVLALTAAIVIAIGLITLILTTVTVKDPIDIHSIVRRNFLCIEDFESAWTGDHGGFITPFDSATSPPQKRAYWVGCTLDSGAVYVIPHKYDGLKVDDWLRKSDAIIASGPLIVKGFNVPRITSGLVLGP